MRLRTFTMSLLAVGLITACDDHGHSHGEGGHDHEEAAHEEAAHEEEGHGHGEGTTAVTIWTDRTELFMEYPGLVVGESAALIVHFSRMSDFKPVTEGSLTAEFISTSGRNVTARAEAPGRPGIFLPEVLFDRPGAYTLELRLNSPQVSDTLRVEGVTVYARASDIPHAEEEEAEGAISYLKEQQWKIDFRTEPAERRTLSGSVAAVGEILPKIQAHAEVPALVNGVMLPDQNTDIPSVGTWVRRGQILAVVSPAGHTDAGLSRIRKDYLLAATEYNRSRRLLEKGAISQKRLDEARLSYEAQKAGYQAIEDQVDFGGNGSGSLAGAVAHYHVKSPIDGIVEAIHFHAGEAVEAGQRLFTVTNPERVWLQAKVPLAHVERIRHATDASFRVEGYDREFDVKTLNGSVISVGSIADRASRTIPVLFELDNPDRMLKIHTFADVSVKTRDIVDALAIPIAAVYDDNGTPVAYVHAEGETFERRALRTGVSDRGYIQILDGITTGERVVTEGGYQVRLASLSTDVPTGHGHAH